METPDDRDLLDAFADGELDETRHSDAAKRFRNDAESRAYADGVSKLKKSLASMWASETAPDALHDRIRDDLARAGSRESDKPKRREIRDDPILATWSPRQVSLLVVAAAIVLAVTVWQLWPEERGRAVQMGRMVVRDVSTAVKLHREAEAGVLADDVRVEAGNEREARQVLSSALEIEVLAPDLTPHGFAFEGARHCVVEGLPAAQVVYRRDSTHTTLSLFSTRKLERLRSGVAAAGVLEVFVASGRDLTAVAWHVGPASYVACASLPTTQLLAVLGLSNAAARAHRPELDPNEFGSLVTNQVPGYDDPEPAPGRGPGRDPDTTPWIRRPAPGIASGAKWIVWIRQAIVMGCSRSTRGATGA